MLQSQQMKYAYTLFLLIGLSFGLQAQCLSPTNFVATNVSPSSVEIDLTASGAGPWEFEYGVLGFTLGSGSSYNSNANIVSLTNLAPATTYRVYLRRRCGSLRSSWASFTFSTSCGSISTAPVSYNFDSPAWQSPTNPTGTGTLGTCWIVSPYATNTFWSVGPPHDTRLNTGPEGDHSTGYGSFIHLNGLGISLDSLSHLQSPAIDLNGLANPLLSFWYHMYGANIDSLVVMARLSAAVDWDTLHTFRGPQQMSQSEAWLPQTISLSAYKDSVIYIQFSGYGKGAEVQIALDDISFYDAGSCQPSSYFHSVSNDDTSVLLSWDPGSGTSFKIEYGPTGFSLGSGTQITVGGAPYRIANLAPDSSYSFYLKDDCINTQSAWIGPIHIKTDCPALPAPFTETFEGADWPIGGLQECWDRFSQLDFKWQTGPPGLNYVQSGPGANNHTPGGSQFIVADRPNQKGNPRSSITSPLIDLDTISNPELIFWTHMFGLQITAFDISIDSGDGFILFKRIIGPQQLSKSAPWTEQIIALPGYTGKKIKVKFTSIASSNWSSLSRIGVDDFYIGEAPPCRKPTNLQATQLAFSSATINWLSGGASNWLLRLKPSGGNSTITPISSNPFDLNSLQAGTEYTVWVRDSCGPGDVSDWSAPFVFKTYCFPDTTPYFQDFEDAQFLVQSSWFNTGTMHPCWQRSHELGALWQPSPASILPNNLLTTSDHTTGSGKFIGGTLFLGNGTNEPTSFSSPHIDLSNLTNPELSFWYFLGGYSFYTNQIQVAVNNGSGWQTVSTIYGPQQLSTSDAWLEQVVDLSAYKDDTIQLRFTTIGNNLYSTSAGGIDDISIHNNPACLMPANLEALSVGITEASLKWTSGGASNWVVRFKPEGGIFQTQVSAVNDSFALNGLMPGTPYEIWVRDSCGPDVSNWLGPLYITTECLPSPVPYFEGFDGPSWQVAPNLNKPGIIDLCWRRSDSVYGVWIPKAGASGNPSSGPANARSGAGNYLMSEVLQSSPQSGPILTEMRSPLIDNSGLQDPELLFWYHMYGSQIQKLWVYVEKMDDSRVLIDSIIGQQQSNATRPWEQHAVSLSGFNGDTLKIVFVAKIGNISGFGNIAIDEVEIVDGICSLPSNLSASNISFSAATLNWTTSSSNLSNLQYGLAGFNLGSGTLVNGVNSGYNLSGLQAFTTYEFYVQDSCRISNSAWQGPFAFTTACAAPIADFSEQGNALTINFDGSPSLGTALNYTWDFGDGNTGSVLNPSHTYTNAGFYTVQLVCTDTCGLTDTISRSIQVCEAAQANITYTRTGLNVSFSAQSSTGASQYFWDFGNLGTANGDTTSLSFPAKGSYPIYLVVSNACGDTDTSFLNLLICDKPTASFTNRINIFNNVMVVNFDGTASTFADSFLWDFGDGTQDSSSLSPTHIYPSTSLNYLVRLIIRADCGLADTLAYPLSGPVSLDEEEFIQLSVYPNPTKNRLIVNSVKLDLLEQQFLCFDKSGKQHPVEIVSKSTHEIEFNVSHLAAGEYLLVVNGVSGAVLKIIVEP